MNEAVRLGLLKLVQESKLHRWDDQTFADYNAALLSLDTSGVLISRAFIKDVAFLSDEIPQIRNHINVILLKLSRQETAKLKISSTEIKHLFAIHIPMFPKSLKLLYRKQSDQIIACRVGYTTQVL